MSFVLVINIDENFNNHYLQNDHSVLNMWSQSSQKLGLEINDYAFKSPSSPNPWHVCGRGSSWMVVTRKRHNSGCQFSWTFITRKRGFSWKFITRKRGFFWKFVTRKKQEKAVVFFYVRHQEAVVTWLEATSSLGRGGFVVSIIGRSASLASNMSPRRKQCHEEKTCCQEQHGTRNRQACIIRKKTHLSCLPIIANYSSCVDMFLKLSLGSSIIVAVYIHKKKSYFFPLPKFIRFLMNWNKID